MPGTDPGQSLEQKFGENHGLLDAGIQRRAWILDWMVSQHL